MKQPGPKHAKHAEREPPAPRSLLGRALKGFGRFWWDFLVGDTPELFVATVVGLGVIAMIAKTVSATAAWVVLPVLVVAALLGSVLRGRRRA
jgi:hypothetical protein